MTIISWALAPPVAQAQDDLKKSIVSGQWQTSEGVPTEMASRFHVAIGTALADSFVVLEGSASEPEPAKETEAKPESDDIFSQIESEAKTDAKTETDASQFKAPPGAQLVVQGTLERVLEKAAAPHATLVQAKLSQARTGEVLGAFEATIAGDSTDAVSDDALRAAARQIAQRVAAAAAGVPWEAQVSQIQEATNGVVIRVYLRAGSRHGLKENRRFSVYRPGQAVTDPETGEVLEPAKDRRLGVVRIQKVTATTAVGEPMMGDGFKAGDVIRLTPPSTR